MNHLANGQALHTSKIQKQIDNISGNETPVLEPAIGFQAQNDEEYYEEDN